MYPKFYFLVLFILVNLSFLFLSFLFWVISHYFIRQNAMDFYPQCNLLDWGMYKFYCSNGNPDFQHFHPSEVLKSNQPRVPRACWWKRLRNHFSSHGCFAQKNICPGETESITDSWKEKQRAHHLVDLALECALGRTFPGMPCKLGCRNHRQMGLLVMIFSLPSWEISSKGLRE